LGRNCRKAGEGIHVGFINRAHLSIIKLMLIGIDCRLWNQTGVGRYTRNLVQRLEEIDKHNEYILFFRQEDKKEFKIQNLKFKIQTADFAWHSLEEQIDFPRLLGKYSLDLMHFPYFSVPLFYKKPYVVTIHDLIVNKFSTGKASTLPYFLYRLKRVGYKIVVSNALKNAKKIITPSNAVKQDILQNYKNINSEKIDVTYEGGIEQISKLRALNLELPKGKYILRVGNFYPHKNIETLLSAFKSFSISFPDFKLVLVGKKDFFYKKIEKQIELLEIKRSVEFIDNPQDSLLFSLYKNATATVVPSFMEGFSLTAVEAMGVGCPLIVSDISVHREICGNSALFFDASEKEELTLALTEIVRNNKIREELIKKGRTQAKKYSWGKMAEQTLTIYTSINSA